MSATAASTVRRSSVELGTAFEKHSLNYLNNHLHMSLRRVGRAGDGGVDVRGSWYVPAEAGPSRLRGRPMQSAGEASEGWRRIRVIGQCKAEKKSLGPRTVRELEGVVAHLQGTARKARERSLSSTPASLSSATDSNPDLDLDPDGDASGQDGDILAILLSQSGFSKNAMVHAARSHAPLMLVHLPGRIPDTAEGSDRAGDTELRDGSGGDGGVEVEGVWWNPALAGPAGLLGGKLELRREILPGSGADPVTGETMIRARYAVLLNGRRLERTGPPLED